jgi:hypothetical protein
MKAIFLILSLSFICASIQAQTGTEILFTKGAELEYKTFTSRPKGFKLELYETTRITLIVTDVIDSNNITYSYITKKGTGIVNPEKDNYEKKLVITRTSDGLIKLPVNLYFIDTSYLADKYHEKKKMKGFHAIASPKGNDTYTLSVDLEKGKFNYSPQTIVTDFLVRDFVIQTKNNPNYDIRDAAAGKQGYTTSPFTTSTDLVETKYSIASTAKEYKVAGKKKITTPAGNFDCYKIVTRTELKIEKKTIEPITVIYYHPEIGFIKWEQEDTDTNTGYIELIRVKR